MNVGAWWNNTAHNFQVCSICDKGVKDETGSRLNLIKLFCFYTLRDK